MMGGDRVDQFRLVAAAESFCSVYTYLPTTITLADCSRLLKAFCFRFHSFNCVGPYERVYIILIGVGKAKTPKYIFNHVINFMFFFSCFE